MAILKPFAEASDEMQASKEVTASKVLPRVSQLISLTDVESHENHMKPTFNSNAPTVVLNDQSLCLLDSMHTDTVSRFVDKLRPDAREDMLLASMCDPRFKVLSSKLLDLYKITKAQCDKMFITVWKGDYAPKSPAPLETLLTAGAC